MSPSTIRRIHCQSNFPPKRKRRPPKVHRPRTRKPQAGMLVQIDASFHRWLEDTEPFALLAAIDDATGEIVSATFRSREDIERYFLLLKQLIEQKGIPMSLYSDRHTIFRSPKEDALSVEEELAGETFPLSQFGAALQELGITHIKALTPQAKGRIERLFGTLQNRWVVELPLHSIHSIEEANRILSHLIEKHNRLFAVQPADPEDTYVPLSDGETQYDPVLSRETYDWSWGNYFLRRKNLKITAKNDKLTIPMKTRVEIRETLNGERFI